MIQRDDVEHPGLWEYDPLLLIGKPLAWIPDPLAWIPQPLRERRYLSRLRQAQVTSIIKTHPVATKRFIDTDGSRKIVGPSVAAL